MHAPDGKNFPQEVVFVEITKPERIILDHVSQPKFRITATFEARGNQTFATFHQLFDSADDCKNIRPIATPVNEQLFDKMAAQLAEMVS